MAAKTSLAFRKAIFGDSSIRDILSDSVIRIFAGTEPASADDSIGSATVLADITDINGYGLRFEVGEDGVLRKDSSQQWQGTATNSGTATFFRIVKASDINGQASTEVRIQGSVGEGYGEMVLTNPNITSGGIIPINGFSMYLPSSN